MATVTLHADDAEDGRLPRVCALSGERTGDQTEHRFTWVPLPLYILSMIIPYGRLVRRLNQKEMTVRLPLQERYHWHWGWRIAVWLGLVLVGIVAVAAGMFLQSTTQPGVSAVLWIGGLLALLVGVVLRLVLTLTSVHATEITHNSITLTNVHPAFAAAVEAARDEHEDDDWDDEDRGWERRKRRRGRDRDDDDDDRPRRARRADDDDDRY